MDYHSLNDFINLIAQGEISPGFPIEIRNMNHNTVHNVPFLDHCDHLCKKHNTDRLRLLSVIQQKLNGDMIVRLNRSPVFNDKIKGLMGEWGEQSEPLELFRCPNNCYDSTNVGKIVELVKSNDNDYSKVNSESTESTDTDSGLYEMMEKLKGNYHTCGGDIQRNLVEIDERRNEYSPNPRYRDILCDLSTKSKSFYLDSLLNDMENEKITAGVNRRINKGIPEKIHVIFQNSLLIPTLMAKSMEDHRSECMRMKESLEQKQNKINDVMVRIGPSEPLSDSILNLLSGITTYFEEHGEDLPSDDDEDPSEDQIKTVLDTLVNRSFEEGIDVNDGLGDSDDEVDNDDGKDEVNGEPSEMHYLKIAQDVHDATDNQSSGVSFF
jgi:hypothetical protein